MFTKLVMNLFLNNINIINTFNIPIVIHSIY